LLRAQSFAAVGERRAFGSGREPPFPEVGFILIAILEEKAFNSGDPDVPEGVGPTDSPLFHEK
jgi:hypothetical protein